MSPRRRNRRAVATVHLWGALAGCLSLAPAALAAQTASVAVLPGSIRADPRVRAFNEAYGALIDSTVYRDGDLVFYLRGEPIRFQDGRMIRASRAPDGEGCDPVFYPYSLVPLREPLPVVEPMPIHCTDVLETLWGSTEAEVREHGRGVRFLDHRMYVNELILGPLAAVEREIDALALRDSAVAAWVADIEITYSFTSRDIAGSPTRSQHAFGMAFDLVPTSYRGRHVYWRWSRALEGDDWEDIPIPQRWSVPDAVLTVFERHGFVWGGKWARFDTMHFEYRPEIIAYNRMLRTAERAPGASGR